MPKVKIKGKQLAGSGVDSYIIRDHSITKDDLAYNSFDGSMFIDGSIPDSKLSDSVTKQGNVFNGPNQLLKLDYNGIIPPEVGIDVHLNTFDLLDVDGPVNSPNGLVKLGGSGELFLNSSISFPGISVNPSVSSSECKVFFNILEKKVHFKTSDYDNIIHIDIFNETPSGVMDGINNEFFLSKQPVLNTERVYVNGLREKKGSGYSVVGNRIIFSEPPKPGYEIVVDYKY